MSIWLSVSVSVSSRYASNPEIFSWEIRLAKTPTEVTIQQVLNDLGFLSGKPQN
jgi:peptidoglycan hydrolase-like protein with peptidoglycan-binding domain